MRLKNRVEKLEQKSTPRREFIPDNLFDLYKLESTPGTKEFKEFQELYNPLRNESK